MTEYELDLIDLINDALGGQDMDLFYNEIDHIRHIVKGECFGIVIHERGKDDPHITISIIVEDDENWAITKTASMSSFWLSDFKNVLNEADKWIQENCTKDPLGFGFYTLLKD